jgi:hypothetical protein
MSRLDSVIRRLQAQRSCIDHAIGLIADRPGPVFEVGLGNGRTYDHLRDRMPGRAIYAFDRQVAAHPDCIPPGDYLVLGDARQTLRATAASRGRAVLLHSDIGTGDAVANAALALELAPAYAEALAPGGILISDQPLADPSFEPLALPAGVAPGRYHLYRRR